MAGKRAGSVHPDGYWSVYVAGKSRRAHHVVWFLTHGEWPQQLDHRDGNRSNNCITNLRHASTSENARNRRMPLREFPQGVSKRGNYNSYQGYVEVDGVKHRRSFRTVEEAHEWVIATRKELHGAFAVDLPKNTLGKRKTLLSN